MNIRVKAALITAGMLAGTILSVLVLHTLVTALTVEQLTTLIGVGFVGFVVYLLYGITLNRLEYQKLLEEMAKKK